MRSKDYRQIKVSKFLSYLLRHSDLETDEEGWVSLEKIVDTIGERYSVDEDYIRKIVEKDKKGRYQIQEGYIRASYGHTKEVDVTHAPAERDILFHGTTENRAKKILEEGLKPGDRQKVHLSKTQEDAYTVARRHTAEPVILEVDVEKTRDHGLNVEKASEHVYVADKIPADCISRI